MNRKDSVFLKDCSGRICRISISLSSKGNAEDERVKKRNGGTCGFLSCSIFFRVAECCVETTMSCSPLRAVAWTK